MASNSTELPIRKFKKDILRAVDRSQSLVVVGQTGSGKTTQLPKYLCRSGYSKHGLIGVTQPRRVAAMSVARRVAEELDCELGTKVGYQVRFDDCTSKETTIKYMTDGCLLREFLDDRELSRYSVIILDEAHERSLDTDILFGLVNQLFLSGLSTKRKYPLKVIVMSATLDAGKFSEFLGNCPIFEIPGRLHPVKEIFCDLVEAKDMERNATINYVSKVVEVVMEIHLEQKQGDILVFLTGQAEIEQCCDMLFKKSEHLDYRHDVSDRSVKALMVLPVYGSMPTEMQRRIFEPPEPGVRKCVVATNIAGTSLTIDGIKYVVDSGFVKQMSYNPRTGLDSLQVVPISRSEATQRSGRAGRTSPGKSYRIYSKDFYEQCMTEDMIPEIQRTSLSSVVLNLKCMGIHNILEFPYVDPPEERMLLEALRQLFYFGAIDRKGHIQPLGHLMVEYPLPPGLSRAVIYSGALDCHHQVLPVAAMLSSENVFIRPADERKQADAAKAHKRLSRMGGGTSDFGSLLAVFRCCSQSDSSSAWCRENYIHWRAVKMAMSVHDQLQSILSKQMKRSDFPKEKVDSSLKKESLLSKALCSGFFGNVARRATSGRGFRTMEGHGTYVFIHPSSVLFGREDELDWVMFHEIVWTSKVFMRTVCSIDYDWVKDLLPRLHEVDAYGLSGCLKPEINESGDPTDTEKDTPTNTPAVKKVAEKEEKSLKRNSESAISEARQRYLERKKAKTVR
ncbi:putative ATP-dependent RNA helicase DHX40 [Holothuria leucospilota]|uniref:RNA helicase n=1 Tax=Holothuria leucospilota TaxID=206669 RepID=A0A9Q1C3U3_HOLLE|nr:putative ATP-dependent RNA helicase DHX40 [Holothuria leucospilota]